MKLNLCEIEIIQEKINYHPNPTEVFNHICNLKSATLLLESAEINKKRNLESMLIIDSSLRITAFENIVNFQSFSKNGDFILNNLDSFVPKNVQNLISSNKRQLIFPKTEKNLDQDEDSNLHSISVFDSLRWLLKTANKNPSFPRSMFLGGMFSYDLVNNFESIKKLQTYQKCPDFCFYLSEIMLTWDHQKKTCIIQASHFNNKKTEKTRLRKRIQEIKKILQEKINLICPKFLPHMEIDCNKSDSQYIEIIKKLQKKIKQGDIFQIVPSRRFFLPCISPLSAYDELKKQNPSPYMFFMQDFDFTLFGASPESALKYDPNSRKIEIHPIAGTRSRALKKDGTIDLDLDSRIELEMRTDCKELSEHLMLVDLARNDLSRICSPGTRFVEELTKVDRYSYVMHLVSKVVGTLKKNLDILHAYRACMNMGTLTGAPKIKAMELIAEVEKEKRGSYGGAIGYITAFENFDMCIIIRSAYVENNIATVQSGAGILIDSNPILEAIESKNKAKSVLNAIINSHLKTPLRAT